MESQLQQNLSEVEKLRRENSISQLEYQAKLREANNKFVENTQRLEAEVANLREEATRGGAKKKDLAYNISKGLKKFGKKFGF